MCVRLGYALFWSDPVTRVFPGAADMCRGGRIQYGCGDADIRGTLNDFAELQHFLRLPVIPILLCDVLSQGLVQRS